MKCEPPRSPLGDVIVSDLYLFTAFADTFKREKKVSPRTGIRIQNKWLSTGLLGARIQTQARAHKCMCTDVSMHTHACSQPGVYQWK